jgi:hypothetical protein
MSDVSPEDRNSVVQLATAFAWDIDHCAGAGVAALFQSDGVYGYDGFKMHGTEAISDFYRERRERGRRLSRHVFSEPHIVKEQDGTLSVWSVLTLYAADGEPPFPPSPVAIMDYHDCIVRTQNGLLYACRWVTPLFGHMPQLVAAQQQGTAQ